MTLTTNRQVTLASRPTGIAQADNFRIIEAPIPNLEDGQILIQNKFLSVEPAMRGWIADTSNYSPPVAIGAVMRSLASGHVIASRNADYKEGDAVTGWFGWQEVAAVGADQIIRRIEETDLPLSLSLGALGLNGVTAYLGLTRLGRPKAGETVLVSTAAGSVGSAVGQIANLLGCRTVGITGGPIKAALCTDEFGYAAALDYRQDGLDLDAALAAACPDGVDIYFDNTAGAISDAAHRHLALHARVVLCGTASIPGWDVWPTGARVERHLLVKRATMAGFLIFDHMDGYGDAVQRLADWVRAGNLQYREDVLDGLEACPDAIAGLYRGENLGKRLIRLEP
ncbi:MAG: NADP-dependent oxidoreductase [Pseudomonadota bacterium]